jgi:hypothetical protein
MAVAGNSTLAVQEFLAQTLMITLQQPGKPRSIVVAPQRMPSASQAQTMAQALTALQGGNWSQSADLSAATEAKPDAGATTRVPSAYPSSLRKQELPPKTFEQIEETQRKINKFRVILTEEDRVITPFGRALNRAMSTSWRGHEAEEVVYRYGVDAYIDELTEQVALIEKSEAKLSGRSATIPVTVQNNLVQGVDHLVLRLTSEQPSRLHIGDGPYSEQRVEVSGGHSQSVKFTANGRANGRYAVTAQLYTEDGQPYGRSIKFDVNVTEFTPAVMLVIAGGVLLLVLAGFRMYTQRKRAAARQAEEGLDDGPEDDAEDGREEAFHSESETKSEAESGLASPVESGADDPEQPSDPPPDTAPESTGPSGTGERVDR